MAKTWTNAAPTAGTKYKTALVVETMAAIDTLWYRRGAAVTGGTTGTTVTLSPAEASVGYTIVPIFNAAPGLDVGHIWVEVADKLVGSFKIKNDGASGVAIEWLLLRWPA